MISILVLRVQAWTELPDVECLHDREKEPALHHVPQNFNIEIGRFQLAAAHVLYHWSICRRPVFSKSSGKVSASFANIARFTMWT